ncbi:MAG: acetylxylan esterase [Clostridia bacterium]|nr:acetylxylan esterase [Clostridia bacterium]
MNIKNLPMPNGMNKNEIINILLKEEYGFLPSAPQSITAELESTDTGFCAGKADLKTLRLNCCAEWGNFSFPVYYVCPNNIDNPVPCFIHINFRDLIPDRYQPTEELVDAGYATLTFCYSDITSDNDDFTNGLAGVVYNNGQRKKDQCGKIGLWAWAAMRVMDYAITLPELDSTKISVAGHSRLGKTALLAGALDERFFCAFSNNSGCSGAALSRNKMGETIQKIYNRFPYWFCENYEKYADNEDKMPFDQHYLIAANVPHMVYVASAIEDLWAYPENEYLSCVAASSYYEEHGLTGFVHTDKFPSAGELFHDGNIGYHLRNGNHYFSREDWNYYIKFLNKHSLINKK